MKRCKFVEMKVHAGKHEAADLAIPNGKEQRLVVGVADESELVFAVDQSHRGDMSGELG